MPPAASDSQRLSTVPIALQRWPLVAIPAERTQLVDERSRERQGQRLAAAPRLGARLVLVRAHRRREHLVVPRPTPRRAAAASAARLGRRQRTQLLGERRVTRPEGLRRVGVREVAGPEMAARAAHRSIIKPGLKGCETSLPIICAWSSTAAQLASELTSLCSGTSPSALAIAFAASIVCAYFVSNSRPDACVIAFISTGVISPRFNFFRASAIAAWCFR